MRDGGLGMMRRIALVLVTAVAMLASVMPAARGSAPDRLAYLDQGRLLVLDGEGRSERELAPLQAIDLSGAAWSPDGKSIAYLSSVTWFGEGLVDRKQIRTIRADGSGDRSVYTLRQCCGLPIGVAGQFVSAPTWAPNGNRIAFIVTTVVCPSWGTCGAQSSLMTVRSDGSHPKTVALDVNTGSEPVWSPDGRHIAYTSGAFPTAIHSVRADGIGAPRRVSPLGVVAWAPAWSRDGRIAFLGDASLNSVYMRSGAIWVTRPDGSDAKRLPVSSFDAPSWSPDGRRLAFSAQDGIHTVRADGRDDRRVTAAPNGYVHQWPRWTPSGSRIAYVAMGLDGGSEASLWSVGADRRTPPRRLARFDWYLPTYSWAPR